MHCPYCRHTDSKVLDSRVAEDGGAIRRRRQCPTCERRFTTLEQMQLTVVKRSGVVEPFARDKVISGVRKACKGRPVTEDQLARLGQLVEDSLRASGQPEVPVRRGRGRHPRSAAGAGPGRLPPLRQRLPAVRLRRGLRGRDRPAPGGAGADRDRAADPGPRRRRQGQHLHPAPADPGPGRRPGRHPPVRAPVTGHQTPGLARAAGEGLRGSGPVHTTSDYISEVLTHQPHAATSPRRPPRKVDMTETTRPASGRSDAKRSGRKTPGLTVERVFTTGVHPYAEVTWERRDVVQTNWKTGEVVFEQKGVEFPDFWSVNASTIVTTKYFRGALGTPVREQSLRQLIDRVVKTYRQAGEDYGYFATPEDAEVFEHELTWMLLHQYFSFNSPVWFNVGTASPQQVSACFILSVDDSMDSILNWYREEGFIFKGGSGAGLNLSRIRSSKELLSSGGTASGPVSFMRGADASAGTIKSGGATRRAAKMVVLDVDHPDIEEFIETKAREENKIRALRDAGYDMDLGGKDITSVQYQNANNSVRVTDEFMRAVEDGSPFGLRARRRPGDRDRRRPRAVRQDRPGGLGVRRPRHPVRRHHQRLAHQSRDRPDHRVQPLLGVHVAGQLLLQPGQPQPAEVPAGGRHLRRGEVRAGRRADHHRDGHLDLLRRLPDHRDRGDDPRLPSARHRVRQPGRAADGHRPRLRLRRRSGAGRGDHLADDRHLLPSLGRAGRDRRPVRRVRPQRRRAPAGDAQAPGGQRRAAHRRHAGRRRAQAGHQGLGRRAQDRRRPTATATRRPVCWRRPAASPRTPWSPPTAA